MAKLFAALLLSVSGIAIAAAGTGPTFYAGGPQGGGWGKRGPSPAPHFNAPEIDPSSAITAMTLLLGGLTVMRGRGGKR